MSSSSSSSSSSSTTTATFSLDHLTPSPSDQLCYVHCSFCDTDLAVSVPCTSMYKTVTVRCGFCSNLLSVNMRALHVPSSNQIHLGNSLSTTSSQHTHLDLLDENSCTPPPLMLDHHQHQHQQQQNQSNITTKESMASNKRPEESIQNYPAVNRQKGNTDKGIDGIRRRALASLCTFWPGRAATTPWKLDHIDNSTASLPSVANTPEKRQRVPSAYNRFIKDEIQRIKAGNPDITHREAFSAAAKNWAHFPHIHFGLMHDHGLKKNNMRQQDDHGFYTAAAANMRLTPY